MRELLDLVDGKTVALVGSAQSILDRDDGDAIDSHDVVIRMNLSIPPRLPKAKIGKKTDVWCMAKSFRSIETPSGVKLVLFMKLTKYGDHDWITVQRERANAIRWPQDLEDDVYQFVGAPPGTGIRLLYWLKKHANPSSVHVYGMDCWKTPSSWSGLPAPAHNPQLEQIAHDELMR